MSAEITVARGKGESGGLAHRLPGHDLNRQCKLPHHVFDHEKLLVVFLSEYRDVWSYDIEQLQHDCSYADEESGTATPFQNVCQISRRLHLSSGLPDAALAAVRGGTLSSWAANRVVAPLARANTEHAARLLAALTATPLTTRELHCWFEHYQQAARGVRERMVSQPRLFLDAVQANQARRASERLHGGPEGECINDLRCLEAVIARLRSVATLHPLPPPLIAAAPRLRAARSCRCRLERHTPKYHPPTGTPELPVAAARNEGTDHD